MKVKQSKATQTESLCYGAVSPGRQVLLAPVLRFLGAVRRCAVLHEQGLAWFRHQSRYTSRYEGSGHRPEVRSGGDQKHMCGFVKLSHSYFHRRVRADVVQK